MKLNDIEVGGRYTAKVSGKIQMVKIVAVREAAGWSRSKTMIEAVNEATGRRITIRSPQRLRRRVDGGCEFCQQPGVNRPAGQAFVCPYCGKAWKAAHST